MALDPDTGKLKWHFQFTPHDLFDYDATETAVLVDTVYQGEPRKLLVEANRNGFVYVLDRTDGKFLSATRFAEKLNWATGIDGNGRPMRTEVAPTANGTLVFRIRRRDELVFAFLQSRNALALFSGARIARRTS